MIVGLKNNSMDSKFVVLVQWKPFRDDLIEVCTQDHCNKDGNNSRKHNEKGKHFSDFATDFTGIAKAADMGPAEPTKLQ